jgi:hypothetical protein
MEGYTCEVVFVTESASPPPGFTKTVMPSGAVIYSKKSLAAEIAEIVVVEVAIAATGSVVLEGMVAPRLAMLAERLKTEFALLRRAGTIGRQQNVQERVVVRAVINAKNSSRSLNVTEVATTEAKPTNAIRNTSIRPYYPANEGFLGPTEKVFLKPGDVIDRYGGSEYSRYFSPGGTPKCARSLPPDTAVQPLRRFEVLKPLEVESGTVAPAYGELGYGLQYKTPVQLDILLKRGVLREIK